MSYLNENHREFYEYFCAQYAVKQMNGRVQTLVNTNMFVESFQSLSESRYLQQPAKQKSRSPFVCSTEDCMRPCVHTLRKVEFGKVTHRRCEINKRHKSAQYFYKTSHVRLYKEDSINTWTIESLTDNGKQYTIQRLNVECSCALTCSDCSIVFAFTCAHVLALMPLVQYVNM